MPITEYQTLRDFYPHLPQNSSYWDRLPPELQGYIMRLARNQILLERRRNKKLRRLLNEIVAYGKLKEQWGIAHINIVIVRCNSPCCLKRKKEDRFTHMKIFGCYIDIDDKPQKTDLSDSYKEAKRRGPIEKTFLYPHNDTKYAHNRWLRKQNRTHSL